MKYEITRDLVKDLWPLYQTNDISEDSRKLVKEFLSLDKEFAENLRKIPTIPEIVPSYRLSPDQERRLLDSARDRARMKLLIIGGSVGLTGFIALIALIALIFLMFSRSV
jgi:hypothetical protein